VDQSFQLCILRLSAIGDVCHAAAMVNRLVSMRPQIKITWIIGKIEYQLLKGMANVEFIVYDKKGGNESNRSLLTSLNGRVFDALFIMQVALRANLLSRKINAKRRIGFDWARSKEGHWLFADERIAAKQHAHVLDGFMGFADVLLNEQNSEIKGQNAYHPQWNIPIESQDRDWAYQQTNPLGQYIVISPAASKAERNWSAKGYAAVAQHCASLGYKVVLCGGPGPLDQQMAEQIMALTDTITLNLVGKTNLKQMLAVLTDAQLVIAPDTGPAHMATTVSTPVIGLYAHSNPLRTGPYMSLARTVSVYAACIEHQKGKSWQQLTWGTRAKGAGLMSLIKEQDVIEQIDQVLVAL